MPHLIAVFILICGLLLPFPLQAQDKGQGPEPTAVATAGSPSVVTGKLYYSLKRRLLMPFTGIITEIYVQPGQPVREGEVLVRYKLEPEAALDLQRQLSDNKLKDMELKLAETDQRLVVLEGKHSEIKLLSESKLAPSGSLKQIERELQLVREQRKLLRERLTIEKQMGEEELALIGTRLGDVVEPGYIPNEATLTAPITGHVVAMDYELRVGAQIHGRTPVLEVAVTDPMLLRAQVHEIEAVGMKTGDPAEFTVESMPDSKFRAKVSRISWVSNTPRLDQPSYFDVEYEVANPELTLKEGYRCQVFLTKPAN
jgi:multidrug resistance efflux pump